MIDPAEMIWGDIKAFAVAQTDEGDKKIVADVFEGLAWVRFLQMPAPLLAACGVCFVIALGYIAVYGEPPPQQATLWDAVAFAAVIALLCALTYLLKRIVFDPLRQRRVADVIGLWVDHPDVVSKAVRESCAVDLPELLATMTGQPRYHICCR